MHELRVRRKMHMQANFLGSGTSFLRGPKHHSLMWAGFGLHLL